MKLEEENQLLKAQLIQCTHAMREVSNEISSCITNQRFVSCATAEAWDVKLSKARGTAVVLAVDEAAILRKQIQTHEREVEAWNLMNSLWCTERAELLDKIEGLRCKSLV